MSLLVLRDRLDAAMSVTFLSKEDVLAGRRPAVTRFERFCNEVVERIDARGRKIRSTIRVDLRGLKLREIRLVRRALENKKWTTRVISDQNDGKRYLLIT